MIYNYDFSDFEEMNPPSPGQEVSPLEHLFRIAATNGNFLALGSSMSRETPPYVVCFAQLPFSMISSYKKLSRPGSSRIFELSFYPASIYIHDDGTQSLLGSDDVSGSQEGIKCTQIIGVTRYWGIRASYYRHYLNGVTPNGLREGIIVKGSRSWMKLNQPLNCAMYENDLARRLLDDFFIAVKRSMPTEHSTSYSRLLNYFIMPVSGRVAFGGKPIPTLQKIQSAMPKFNEKSKAMIKKKKTVFLSYGGPDVGIAESLRNDLEKSGIDTWWFPSNAQWGEKIHHEVSKNILKFDRLLLICSRRSLIRKGVLHEIEEVVDRESEQGGISILIPVAIDDVLDTEWWRYEPDENGNPHLGSLDSGELSRRMALARVLNRRVVGDLKESSPGDEKWLAALERITVVL